MISLGAAAVTLAFFWVYGVWTFCQDVRAVVRERRGRR